jgi:hypothetical protein
MIQPRIAVDFNEMPAKDEVLLSKEDSKADSSGNTVVLTEGMAVAVYCEDFDVEGRQDNLIAEGLAQRNHHAGWAAAAKWLLKIDEKGVRRESDERNEV